MFRLLPCLVSQASLLLMAGCLVLFQRQSVLTAEKVKRTLNRYMISVVIELVASVNQTHQRAMLKPQIDFISRHVAFEVPIH